MKPLNRCSGVMRSTRRAPAAHGHAMLATKGHGKRRGGQTIVETALVLTFIMLPLTLGLIQFGLILNAANTMTQIAREGGRYAAVHCTEPTFDGSDADPATGAQRSLRNYLKTVAQPTGIKWADLQNNVVVTPNTIAGRLSGQPITVSVTYPMANRVFLGSVIFLAPALARVRQPYIAKSTFVIE